MKNHILLKISAALYVLMGFFFLFMVLGWKNNTDNEFNVGVIVFSLVIFIILLLHGLYVYRLKSGSFRKKRNYALFSSIFCGVMTGIGGLIMLFIFGIPLLIALIGLPEIVKSNFNDLIKGVSDK